MNFFFGLLIQTCETLNNNRLSSTRKVPGDVKMVLYTELGAMGSISDVMLNHRPTVGGTR